MYSCAYCPTPSVSDVMEQSLHLPVRPSLTLGPQTASVSVCPLHASLSYLSYYSLTVTISQYLWVQASLQCT